MNAPLRNGFRIHRGVHMPARNFADKAGNIGQFRVIYLEETSRNYRAVEKKGLDSQTNPVKLVWPVAERQGVSPP